MNPPDRVALADLVHRYAAAVDDRRLDDAAALFADDAELVVADPPRSLDPVIHHRGLTAIRAAVAAVTAVDRTEHAIVGEVYTASGPERARGRIACVAHHWTRADDRVRDVVWHLRYDDEYVRHGQNWLFSVRTLTINTVETRAARRLRPG
jgi:ketosteroid isomerase-like protein